MWPTHRISLKHTIQRVSNSNACRSQAGVQTGRRLGKGADIKRCRHHPASATAVTRDAGLNLVRSSHFFFKPESQLWHEISWNLFEYYKQIPIFKNPFILYPEYINYPQSLIKNKLNERCGHITKDNTQMANKHTKRCSTPLVIMEMQIKTTLWWYFTPTGYNQKGR